MDCHFVVGWVWDREKPDAPLTVDIFLDEALIGRVPANELRTDLRDRGFGNGQHGFRFKMPDWVHDGRTHRVEAKVVESGRVLKNTPQEVTCLRH